MTVALIILSLLHADVAAGRDCTRPKRGLDKSHSIGSEWRAHPGADRVVSADHDVLGTNEQQGKHHRAWADEHTIVPSIS